MTNYKKVHVLRTLLHKSTKLSLYLVNIGRKNIFDGNNSDILDNLSKDRDCDYPDVNQKPSVHIAI